MDYLDFELHVGAGTASTYPITILNAPAGSATATADIMVDDILIDHLRAIEQTRSAALATARGPVTPVRQSQGIMVPAGDERAVAEALGRALFDMLLPADLLTCYRHSRDQARRESKCLRLRLRIDAPELAALPWEFLFDAADGDHVSLNRETPLTRCLEIAAPPEPLVVPPPLRILGMVASPNDQVALDVGLEQQHMEEAIEHLVQSGAVEITWLAGQTWRALDAVLADGTTEWHIFHFIGHGAFDAERGEGLLVLADESGSSHLLPARELGRLFARHPTLRLAVINACEGARASETKLFSSTGAILLQRGVPAVVSMQYPITDQAALEFTRNFYDALARKLPVDATMTEARYYLSMTLQDSIEWATPVLYMRPGDGSLFTVDEPSAIFAGAAPVPMGPVAVPSAPAGSAGATHQRGLGILRRKVQQFWIEGVLHNSLFQKAMIDLGMAQEMDAVDTPWATLLELPGAGGQPLPPPQTIAGVFEEVGSSLLILGEPGSGKTTTMLGLARSLLQRCSGDPTCRVPVVFHLSSWVEPHRTLDGWLVEELGAKYQIPHKIGRAWLKENCLLPLLDGLDELRSPRRAACVEAINAFAQTAGPMGMVVCCRLREYRELSARLALNAAVRLLPLTDVQVDSYLAAAGAPLAAVRAALQRDSALRIDARSPLLLSLMVRAYQDLTVAEVMNESSASAARRRQQLMAAYVARMFRRAGLRQAA